jgi:uncharacterized protein (TIGR03083 family)
MDMNTSRPSDSSRDPWSSPGNEDLIQYDDFAPLLALDALDGEEQQTAEVEVDPFEVHGLRRVASTLADFTLVEPPANLREQVLAAAKSRRAPGTPIKDPPVSPSEAFQQTVSELHQLLKVLNTDEWLAAALAPYGRTRDLVAHLVGVEENLLGLLGEGVPPNPDTWEDHVMATSDYVRALQTESTDALLRRWARSARRLNSVASRLPQDQTIAVNDVETTIRGMLILRTFEVWTHHEDVCRATNRPLPILDSGRLQLMSSELMDALPVALTVTGKADSRRTMKIVLTGPGGGTYLRPMAVDSAVGLPDVIITANIVDFCRVAAQRMKPGDLPAHIEGDASLADRVLVAASAFARD